MRAFVLLLCAIASGVGCVHRVSSGSDRVFEYSHVAFSGSATIESPPNGESKLVVFARLRNLTDTTIMVESSVSDCEPPIVFVNTVTNHRFVWGHVAWRRQHVPVAPPLSVVCVGTDLIVTLRPRGDGELGRQGYPVRMIRGDSIPAGRYVIGIPVHIDRWENGFVRDDTLRIWSQPSVLP